MNGTPERNKEKVLDLLLVAFFLLLVITTVVLLLPAWQNYRKISAGEELERRKLEAARRERQIYLERRDRLQHSPAEVEKVAREKFNFARKGEVVISYPPEKKPSAPSGRPSPVPPTRKKR
ncbi:MAG: septum formation initiator family protein [Lentisphaeria bacterium]|nr:septum formation initiator family protein [Lentisphaeria bacterium]